MLAAERREYLYRLSVAMLHLGLRLYNRFEVHGKAHVPVEGGCVLASNHASFMDPPIIASGALHRAVRFMARDTLFRGFMGWFLPRVCVIPLSRERGDVGAMRKSIELLRKGNCVGLFPEGTRTLDGQLQPAKGGVGFLLAKAQVPVVPAYINGSYAAYPKGASRIKPAKVTITFGPPISPAEIAAMGSDREAYERVGQLVMARITALREVAERK
jgi:1-acyl-sn-glycerol-3-phosphate acyltransferase